MSFQAYKKHRRENSENTRRLQKACRKEGTVKAGVKAKEIVTWLKEDFDLGHGHAMAIYAMLSGKIDPAADR